MHMAAAPKPMQVPAMQVRPAQQAWFIPPQAWQARAVPPSPTAAQRNPALQVPPPAAQQAWFSPPQATQLRPASPAPATQSALPWQMFPGQQAPPVAPQFMQVRAIPMPGLAQPRPLLHVSPVQQALPLVPHT